MKMKPAFSFLWAALLALGSAQYLGEEELDPLQKTAVIGGEQRDLDQIGPTILTNRTTTTLNCAGGNMHIGVQFKEPFFGIIYPNGSRTSACLTHGTGDTHYDLVLPLKGCGTKRVERRVFMNNIMVRFHKGLELEIDEVKTIICRYPSPEVLVPAPLGPLIAPAPPPALVNRVGEVEILMIICAILFMALLLVGMACSYTCLKKRNIRIVRRRPISGPPSEISKSETLPSDYPSESPSSGSEVEEVDVQEHEDKLSSVYSDAFLQSEADFVAAHQMLKPPKPTFMVRVKNLVTPPRTPEPDYPIQSALSQSLTTILERDESLRASSLPGSEHALMMTESEDDFYPPPVIYEGPELEGTARLRQEQLVYRPPPPPSDIESVVRSESETELIIETHAPPKHYDMKQIDTVTTLTKEITDVDETVNRGKRKYLAPRPPSEPDSEYPSETRSVTDTIEEMAVARPPQISTHNVDDRYMTTVTETNVTEDVQKHHRYIKQYRMKPKALPSPKWNVAIRHYPGPKYADEYESSGPEWEAYSEPGSDVFRSAMMHGADETLSQIEVEMLEHPPPPPNWNVLIRVLEPPQTEEAVQYILTREDREKWRQIITTESTLRTMLTQASVREDYERIRRDQRYEKLFPQKKWDVIIRILSPPEGPRPIDETSSEAPSASDAESLPSRDPRRHGRRDAPGVPPKKTNLPPLYEYDADGNPIVRIIEPSSRSRRSSKSSMVSGLDVRSIPETEVNFTRETWSEVSSVPRSHTDRSQTEITFGHPQIIMHPDDHDTDYDDRSSARTARSLARSASEFTEDWRHHDDRYSQSSADSRPHRQMERSTSEYMEEPPHLSDFPTSPEMSPKIQRHGGRDNRGYAHEEHYEHSEYTGDGNQRIFVQEVRSGFSSSQVQSSRGDYQPQVHAIEPDKSKRQKKK